METSSSAFMEEKEEVLRLLETLLQRISKLLESGRLADARRRHCFAFMKMELAVVVESLRPSLARDRGVVVEDDWRPWLTELRLLDRDMERLLLHPPDHPLLTRCFGRRMDLHNQIQFEAYRLHLAAEEHPCNHHHEHHIDLPISSGDHQLGLRDDRLVGVAAPAKKLLEWLTVGADQYSDNNSLRVMAIVGPAGVGKTTLAMELYRRLQRRRRTGEDFECRAVASFSRRRDDQPVRRKLLLRSILSQITGMEASTSSRHTSAATAWDEERLAFKIWKYLRYKRYLILVDDICKDSDWETIKGAFPANYCGSRLLFTTRNELKAGWFLSNYDGTMHKMKPLNDSYSERLLRIKAFDSMDYCPPDNLKILCDEILKKCRGIPLFITSMAEWLKQHQNSHNSFAVPTAEQVRLLFKQFDQKLSFNYSDELSPALCLSMFPHGYVFDKDHFAMKWLEEGLAGIRSGIRLDTEQAKMSFTEMVDKNIISPVSESCGLNLDEDELCQWQVNPFMLNFLASKAAEKGFVFTSSTLASATAGGNKIQKARRLALHHPHPQLSEMLKQMDLSHTRSLLISGAIDRLTIPLGKFAYLVVLDLHGWENLKDDDLLQICKMFFLTYLSIRCTSISKLPPQIKQLRILSTLDISHTHIRELPLELCELHCLNMLDLRATKISQLPEQIGRLSYRLRTLLIGGHGIINSNETVVVIKIPHSLMTVLVLNTLATVDLSDCPASFVEVIGRQGSLEVIAITWPFNQCTDEAYQDALRSSIQRWLRLRSLTIHCGFGSSMEFLDSLNNPPKNLHKLKVTAGRFVNVPQWIKWLQHLAFLQIIVCKLEPDDVKILECLRGLKCLVLGLESVPKEEIVIESDGFSWLERFSLDCPVPWLTFKQGTMPRLMYLELKICSGPANQVNTVPSGLTNLPRIKEVVICYSRWCRNSSSVKMTVEAVRKQVARHPGPIVLFINGRQKISKQLTRRHKGGN